MKECKFCQLKPDDILFETETSYVKLGSQFHRGHTEIIFKKHVENLLELSETDYIRFCSDLRKCARVVENIFRPDQLNYALLGNWVSHLHWHIYPRYKTEPDYAQPPLLQWKIYGERVRPSRVKLKKKPLLVNQKKQLKKAFREVFGKQQ